MINTMKLVLFIAGLSFPFACYSQSNSLGTVALPDVDTGDAFNQVKKMLGTWKGELVHFPYPETDIIRVF